ncbi:hypothetical protein [Actinocrispum wychmicini]|uniref:Uncharacterized protein n=1 Tax=Actinocrispum wychmicini TaxID=1213861 RepID=A0A4R2IY37_9PSEU|nr:hypothetical protein [Actinocrispum wychmicini]TCO48789.1 hypothetical protein EV192_11510 [Actinocrispum wychmicini]
MSHGKGRQGRNTGKHRRQRQATRAAGPKYALPAMVVGGAVAAGTLFAQLTPGSESLVTPLSLGPDTTVAVLPSAAMSRQVVPATQPGGESKDQTASSGKAAVSDLASPPKVAQHPDADSQSGPVRTAVLGGSAGRVQLVAHALPAAEALPTAATEPLAARVEALPAKQPARRNGPVATEFAAVDTPSQKAPRAKATSPATGLDDLVPFGIDTGKQIGKTLGGLAGQTAGGLAGRIAGTLTGNDPDAAQQAGAEAGRQFGEQAGGQAGAVAGGAAAGGVTGAIGGATGTATGTAKTTSDIGRSVGGSVGGAVGQATGSAAGSAAAGAISPALAPIGGTVGGAIGGAVGQEGGAFAGATLGGAVGGAYDGAVAGLGDGFDWFA